MKREKINRLLIHKIIFFLLLGAPQWVWGGGWTNIDNPSYNETIRGIHFPVNNSIGYAAGKVGQMLKTTDGGSTWVSQTTPTTKDLDGGVFFVDNSVGWAVGDSGTIIKTTNGGTSWSTQTSGTTKDLLQVLFPVNADTGFICGGTGTFLKTTNGGATWVPKNLGSTSSMYDIYFANNNTGYVVGSSSYIRKTTNGGENWSTQARTGGSLRSVIFPEDLSTGYCVGLTGTILKTTNGGTNWSNISDSTFANLEFESVHFPEDNSTGYIVGRHGTILKTTDGGSTWNLQASSSSAYFYTVQFPVDGDTGYVGGYGGRICKTVDGGGNSIILHPVGNGSVNNFTNASGCGSGAHWDCVNDQTGNAKAGWPEPHDTTSSYIYDINNNTNREMFALPDTNLFSGVTVTAINIRAHLGGSTPEIEFSYRRIGFDGTPIDGENKFPVGACCIVPEMDEFDGFTWNKEHMDSLEIGIEHVAGGQIDMSQIYVVVGYENFKPTVASAIPDTTVLVGTSSVSNYRDLNSVFNDQEQGGALAFSIQSNSNPSLVTPTIGADSAIDLSFSAGTGSATIVVRATDSGSKYVEDSFVITVEPVNFNVQQIHYRWRNDDGGENAGAADTLEIRVSYPEDDAEQTALSGSMYLNSSDLELTDDVGDQEVGMRFRNVTIPQGANISNAHIEFVVDETTTVSPTNLYFWGEDTNNASVFTTTTYDIANRTKTSASASWLDVPPWNTVGDTFQTPDISSPIQEVVNRSGWSSGNALVIIVTGNAGRRTTEAYDGEPTLAPLLHVEYTTGTGASWAVLEDSLLKGAKVDTLKRLRFEISNEGNISDTTGKTYRLEVSGPNPSCCSCGSYSGVPTDGSGHWQIANSSNLTDGASTTNVSNGLSDENTSFKAGQVKDTGNQTSAITLTTSQFTEIEYALKPNSNAQKGALYCFRLTNAGATTNITYPKYVEAIVEGLSIKDETRNISNGNITVNWTSIPWTIYDIFYADSLTGTYTDIANDTATGYTNNWIDNGTQTPSHPDSVTQRYYRIQKEGGSVSINTVGKYTITLQDTAMSMVSIPFVPYSIDLDTVIGTQLTGGSSELYADRIWKWNLSLGKYKVAWLVSGGPNNGKWWDTETGQESNMTLGADEGFWIQNRHGVQKVSFVGKVSDTPNRTISLAKGIQQIGSSYPVIVTLANSELDQDGAKGAVNELDADRVWEWDPGTETYKFAWLIEGVGPPYDGKWWDSSTGSETTVKLKPGVGLWFEMKDLPGHANFTWTYPKPYSQPPN